MVNLTLTSVDIPTTQKPYKLRNSLDEATVANEDNGNDILDKLESTIEMIKHMISESADMTRNGVKI